MKNDSLGDRIKIYESNSKHFLMRRTPILIRLDGKSFHSFTRGFQKPFDMLLMNTMQCTMEYLCQNIEGCQLGYTQSDEITLLLTDYETIKTEPWFGNNLQKLVSVSASMATMAFNRFFNEGLDLLRQQIDEYGVYEDIGEKQSLLRLYESRVHTAIFDSRAFNIPQDEVCNAFLWRQQDATRNAIQMIAQANFSHKELQNKSCSVLQDMLFKERGLNFNDFLTSLKRGTCCIKKMTCVGANQFRKKWILDTEIPIFTQDRAYIERFVYKGVDYED